MRKLLFKLPHQQMLFEGLPDALSHWVTYISESELTFSREVSNSATNPCQFANVRQDDWQNVNGSFGREIFIYFEVVDGKRSGLQIVPYGVPQGSLLGSKLFSIFVNDLPECISNGEIHLYDDDTTAFIIRKNEDEVVTLLDIIFSEISKWCSINNLTIRPTKCKVMLNSRKSFTGPLKPVKCGNKCLEYRDKVKVPGIYIDNKLTWKPHIKELTKSFNAQLKSLQRISYLSTKDLESIYFKLIIPHINYCISVWGTVKPLLLNPSKHCM